MNCPRCGLPEELCVCYEMTKEGQRIRVRCDKRKFGKIVTVIDGFKDVDLDKIAKELKRKLACGGTAKDDKIELQGNHANRMRDVLVSMGFLSDMIDIL